MIEKAYGSFANRASDFIGSVWSIAILLAGIIGSGIYFGFTERWELILHLAMAFVALIAVFFLQRSQRHDNHAINVKLDELIKAVEGARNSIAGVDKESNEVLEKISKK